MSINPLVLSEDATVEAMHAGRSVARFGDGELALAVGRRSVSQRPDKCLQVELRDVLAGRFGPNVLPCLPPSRGVRAAYFAKYWEAGFRSMYTLPEYGSAFVSRADCAPIDRPAYWDRVRDLWRDQVVLYVSGDERLLRVIEQDADVVGHVKAPIRDAYSLIDDLTRYCLSHRDKRVIIALGAAGTVLAARLGQQGQHALDLGHIGQFMQNPGAFSFNEDDLTSPDYRAEIRQLHREKNWGKGGWSWAPQVKAFAAEIGAVSVLDYGCGQATLSKALAELGVKCANYDPGRPEFSAPPKLCDLVVSTDVFEHIEPEKVDAVLRHTFLIASKGGFFAIAKKPAKAILPVSGRNAHLICEEDAWWIARLKAAGWSDVRVVETAWKKCLIQCRK